MPEHTPNPNRLTIAIGTVDESFVLQAAALRRPYEPEARRAHADSLATEVQRVLADIRAQEWRAQALAVGALATIDLEPIGYAYAFHRTAAPRQFWYAGLFVRPEFCDKGVVPALAQELLAPVHTEAPKTVVSDPVNMFSLLLHGALDTPPDDDVAASLMHMFPQELPENPTAQTAMTAIAAAYPYVMPHDVVQNS